MMWWGLLYWWAVGYLMFSPRLKRWKRDAVSRNTEEQQRIHVSLLADLARTDALEEDLATWGVGKDWIQDKPMVELFETELFDEELETKEEDDMAKQGPEAKLIAKCRAKARAKYGDRLVDIKYHGDIYAEAGVSDLLHCLDGVFCAIEMKAPESYGGSVERALEKGPTVKQRIFVGRVNDAGGVGGFAATEDQYMDLLLVAEHRADSIIVVNS